ncbi:MAG: hypothetical protein SFV81_08490 [Pirellulaceae bacterium]|nr:hypothetical protein [Pirellulaceae bacterium]
MNHSTVTPIVMLWIVAILLGCREPTQPLPSAADDPQTRKIIDLIDRLKDFEWHSFMVPSSDDDFISTLQERRIEFPEDIPEELKERFGTIHRNTAEKLYDCGLDAAPFLIQRLSDKTPTRCVVDFHGVEPVSRPISNVCEIILGKMLGAPDRDVVPTDLAARLEFLQTHFERCLAEHKSTNQAVNRSRR